MESIFDLCVRILLGLVQLTGLTYEQVNVIIFVVLLPLGLIGLIARTVWLERRLVEMGEARRLTLPAVEILFWTGVLVTVLALL